MHIHLSTHDFEFGPHVQELIDTKLHHKLDHHFPHLSQCTATLYISRDKDGVHDTKLTIDLPGPGGLVVAEHRDVDFVLCLTHLAEKVSRQIDKQLHK